jgi:hypothetical protein
MGDICSWRPDPQHAHADWEGKRQQRVRAELKIDCPGGFYKVEYGDTLNEIAFKALKLEHKDDRRYNVTDEDFKEEKQKIIAANEKLYKKRKQCRSGSDEEYVEEYLRAGWQLKIPGVPNDCTRPAGVPKGRPRVAWVLPPVPAGPPEVVARTPVSLVRKEPEPTVPPGRIVIEVCGRGPLPCRNLSPRIREEWTVAHNPEPARRMNLIPRLAIPYVGQQNPLLFRLVPPWAGLMLRSYDRWSDESTTRHRSSGANQLGIPTIPGDPPSWEEYLSSLPGNVGAYRILTPRARK